MEIRKTETHRNVVSLEDLKEGDIFWHMGDLAMKLCNNVYYHFSAACPGQERSTAVRLRDGHTLSLLDNAIVEVAEGFVQVTK